MSLLDTLKQQAKQTWQEWGQLPAGAAELTVANADTPAIAKKRAEYLAAREAAIKGGGLSGIAARIDKANPFNVDNYNYTPAIAAQPGALIDLAQKGLHYIAPKLVDAPAEGGFADTSAQAAITASERTNKTLGVEAPQNAGQLGMRLIGGMLVPSPVKAPAITAATRAGKAAQFARNVAIEAAIPMRQSKLLSVPTAVVPAVGTGIVETIDKFGAPLPGYRNVTETGSDAGDEDPYAVLDGAQAAVPLKQEADPYSVLDGKYPDADKVTAAEEDPYALLEGTQGPPLAVDHELSTFQKGLVGAAVLAGAGLSYSTVRGSIKKLLSAPTIEDLTGTQFTKPRPMEFSPSNKFRGLVPKKVQSVIKQVQTAVTVHDAPIRSAAHEYFGPAEAAHLDNKLDTIIPQALGSKMQSALITGELPGTSITMKPLAPLYEAVGTLDPNEIIVLRHGLLANSALDDFRRTNVQSALNGKTPAELQQMADLVTNDPKLNYLSNEIKNAYGKILDYRQATEFIDDATRIEWKTKRPNYVHMSSDKKDALGVNAPGSTLYRTPMTTDMDALLARGTEEASGVQWGAVRDPIKELQQQLTNAIHDHEVNTLRRQFLGKLVNSRGGSVKITRSDGSQVDLVTRLPKKPDIMDGVIPVYENGRAVYYKIGDPLLAQSLQFNPRATAGLWGVSRQIFQAGTTGVRNILAPFGIVKAPLFDAFLGQINKPAGYSTGLLNEMLNKGYNAFATTPAKQALWKTMIGGQNIGHMDLTWIASPYIGAIRRAWDGHSSQVANTMATHIHMATQSVTGMSDAQVAALHASMKAKYAASIKSQIDEAGAGNAYFGGATRANEINAGLNQLAPTYYRAMSSEAARRARAGMWDSLPQFLEGVLVNSKNAMIQAGGAPVVKQLANLYTGLLRQTQEGYRYQFFATNKPNFQSAREVAELASTTRRIAADVGQHGGGDAWNKIADSVAYSNVGMQGIAESGRRFMREPLTYTLNMVSTLATMALVHYSGLLDPEIDATVKSRTDAQNGSSIIGPGHIELAVPQELRTQWGMMVAFLDNIFKNPDGTFNPNFANALHNYWDAGQEERRGMAVANARDAGLMSLSPVSPSGVPAFNMVLAAGGIDPSMSKITGNPVMLQDQKVDPSEEGRLLGSFTSGSFMKVIEAAAGAGVSGWLEIADEGWRAGKAQNEAGTRGTGPKDAVMVALSAIEDKVAKGGGFPTSMLFKDYDKVDPVATTDYTLYQAKDKGVKRATDIYRNVKEYSGWVTGVDPRHSQLRAIDLVPPNLRGTQLAVIGANAAEMTKDIAFWKKQEDLYTEQAINAKNQQATSIEDRNREVDENNAMRKYYRSRMLFAVKVKEEYIGQQIGDPSFTFQDFDPEKYKKPWQPPQSQPGTPLVQAAPSGQ